MDGPLDSFPHLPSTILIIQLLLFELEYGMGEMLPNLACHELSVSCPSELIFVLVLLCEQLALQLATMQPLNNQLCIWFLRDYIAKSIILSCCMKSISQGNVFFLQVITAPIAAS
jgi:hypothetical protein